jgi:hypothetical protein
MPTRLFRLFVIALLALLLEAATVAVVSADGWPDHSGPVAPG